MSCGHGTQNRRRAYAPIVNDDDDEDGLAAREAELAGRERQAAAGPADPDDPGFAGRFLSGRDVDESAGDRADALHDERCAREDRQRSFEDRHRAFDDRQRASDDRDAAEGAAHEAAATAVEEAAGLREEMEGRTVIGQAQGLFMAEHAITADEALDMLVKKAQTSNVKLRDIAARLVEKRAAG